MKTENIFSFFLAFIVLELLTTGLFSFIYPVFLVFFQEIHQEIRNFGWGLSLIAYLCLLSGLILALRQKQVKHRII